jgi:peroxiredoxin
MKDICLPKSTDEMKNIQPGQEAPDFTLYDTEKKQVTLSALRGQNVLILFFPLAFTSVCTAELCSVRDNIKMYEQLDAQPLGISVDSLYTLARYKAEQNLNFPLLSDFNKEVSEAYGSLYETFSYGMKAVSKRSAFVIDKSGIVRYAEILENAGLQPSFEEIRGKLRELV